MVISGLTPSVLSSEGLPRYVEGALGLLVLEGTERLFAIDGQHRVVGIREAVESDPDIGKEEMVVFHSRMMLLRSRL